MLSCTCCACVNDKEKTCLATRCAFLEHLKRIIQATEEFLTFSRERSLVLWKLSIKYNILLNACPDNIYPVEIVHQVIDDIINEKRKIYKKLQQAQCTWRECYEELCHKYKLFRLAARLVDYETGCRFLIDGCAHTKPLDYYLAAAGDIVYYYRSFRMLIEAKLIEISVHKADTVEKFSKSLNVSEKFLAFMNELLLHSRFLVDNK